MEPIPLPPEIHATMTELIKERNAKANEVRLLNKSITAVASTAAVCLKVPPGYALEDINVGFVPSPAAPK
jgi:hypothetical protein